MRDSDSIEQAMQNFCDRQKAISKMGTKMDEKVIHQATAAYRNSYLTSDRFTQRRLNVIRYVYRLATVVVILGSILIAMQVLHVSPDGAEAVWADTLKIMKDQAWIHVMIDTESSAQDQSQQSQMWFKFDPPLVAMVSDDETRFYDGPANISYVYNSVENTLTVKPTYSVSADGFELLSPVDFVEQALLQMSHDSNTLSSHMENRAGKPVEILVDERPDKVSTLVKDMESGLIESASMRHTEAPQLTLSMSFDYPSQGPMSIYELGIPQDAKFVDQRPSLELEELTTLLTQKCKEGFGDFQAVKCVSNVDPDGTLAPSMLYLTQQQGQLKRFEQYFAADKDRIETQMQSIYQDINGQWPCLDIDRVLALNQPDALMYQSMFNEKRTFTRHWNFRPRRVEREAIPLDTVEVISEWAPALVWPSPQVMMSCPDNLTKAMEMLTPDPEHSGLVGLRVIIDVKKTRWKFHTSVQPQAGVKDYWFDPSKSYILVEELALYESNLNEDGTPQRGLYPNYAKTTVLEFATTDKGHIYPSVIQIIRGDGPDDPDITVELQHLFIDTSPVFEPGTFATESLLQD